MPAKNITHPDVIIVGTGPGGATLARELTSLGRQVTILERGRDHRSSWYYGTHLGAAIYSDRCSFLYSQEGLSIIRPIMLGGATSMYCGSAAPPPAWMQESYGIDLSKEVENTVDELEIVPLPEAQRGEASNRIAHAAQALGYAWQPQAKFMSLKRSPNFNCGAKCMLGCRCQAKWSAVEFIDQAVEAGANLFTGAHIKQVLLDNGRVQGVAGVHRGRFFEMKAPVVVLAAGGLGSPRILQASGFEQAGVGLAMDTTLMVYGFSKERGLASNPPMTWGLKDTELGIMFSTLVDPWLNYPVVMVRRGLKYPLYWPRYGRLLGVMIKLKDDISGRISMTGQISKPLTNADQTRLAQGEQIARGILQEAGADPDTMFTTPLRGTHPSATVRIGDLLDNTLATNILGLYVCDASVFPEALGQPTVLTIIALARRLAQHLAETTLPDRPRAD